MSRSHTSLFLLCAAQLIGLSWGQSCYSPGGSLSSSYFPCYPSASTSLCCPMGWTCFTNNLCIVTDTNAVGSQFVIGTAERGGCTNAEGDNDLCGDYCLDSDNDSLISCGNSRFCCGSNADQGTCNCVTGEGTFAAEGGEAKTIMGQEGMEKTATEVQSTSLTASTSRSTAISTTLSTSTTGGGTSSASQVSDTASSSAQSTSSSTALASPSSSKSFTQKTGFKVMIAVLVVAAAAILIAGLILWRRKQKKAKESEVGPFGDGTSSIDLSNVPLPPSQFRRRDSDPYFFPPTTGSAISAMSENPTETQERTYRDEDSPVDPPVSESHRMPFAMASIPPRPYEGT